jgi:hypothetical protein
VGVYVLLVPLAVAALVARVRGRQGVVDWVEAGWGAVRRLVCGGAERERGRERERGWAAEEEEEAEFHRDQLDDPVSSSQPLLPPPHSPPTSTLSLSLSPSPPPPAWYKALSFISVGYEDTPQGERGEGWWWARRVGLALVAVTVNPLPLKRFLLCLLLNSIAFSSRYLTPFSLSFLNSADTASALLLSATLLSLSLTGEGEATLSAGEGEREREAGVETWTSIITVTMATAHLSWIALLLLSVSLPARRKRVGRWWESFVRRHL